MNRRLLAVLIAGLAMSAPVFAQKGSQIVRESTGQRRAQLEQMELKALPADAWSKLTAWKGDAVTAAALEGKPVLIFAFAAWQPASQRAASIAQQMAERYGEQGLVVVGIHHPQGWERAAKFAEDRKLTFPIAHDAAGDFRKALLIDTMPDWYIIDRAGHLRYAAVAGSSVDAAVAEVTKETREDASDLPRILSERREQEQAAKGRTSNIRSDFDLSSLPAVPPGYVAPDESAYENERLWPKISEEAGNALGLIDQQTKKPLNPPLAFEPEGYYPSEPVVDGRAVVIYIWNPDLHASYGGVMNKMDLLQQQHQRDLVVIGAAVPMRVLNQQMSGNADEEQEGLRLLQRYQNFIRARNFRHLLAADFAGSALAPLQGGRSFPIPGALVVSSDGIIRWAGGVNTSDFKYAVDTVLANDPGVKARREADRRYIENSKR